MRFTDYNKTKLNNFLAGRLLETQMEKTTRFALFTAGFGISVALTGCMSPSIVGTPSGATTVSGLTTNSQVAQSKYALAQSWPKGTGAGNFISPTQLPSVSGSGLATSLIFRDVNGDGIPDAIRTYQGFVGVSLGNADASFQAEQVYSINGLDGGYGIGGIGIADFNGDGNLDIVAFGGFENLIVFLGNGDGTFQPASQGIAYTFQGVGAAIQMVVGDFNNDGIPDVAVEEYCGIIVFIGRGDGTFTNSASLSGCDYWLDGSAGLVAADFNGDGKLDLAMSVDISNMYNTNPPARDLLVVFPGNGDGTFGTAISTLTSSWVSTGGYGQAAITTGDFNGDHKTDIAFVDQNQKLEILISNGDGTFTALTPTPSGNSWTVSLFTADLNHDGKTDLIGIGSGYLDTYLGNGDGTFGTPWSESFDSYGMGGAYYNVPGKENVGILTGNTFIMDPSLGDGTFAPVDTEIFSNGNNNGTAVVSADLNKDGKPDAVIVNSQQNTVSVLLGNGGGSFQPNVDYRVGNNPSAVRVADVNSDGIPDLIVVNTNDATVSILLGNGDGTFQPATATQTGPSPSALAIGDFNGDGIPDLAILTSDPSIEILLGNGDGTFSSPIPDTYYAIQVNSGATGIAIADFNGDANMDLAVSLSGPGVAGVSVFLGNGDGTFTTLRPLTDLIFPAPGALGSSQILAADFNGDGIPDVAVFGNGVLSILLGKGNGMFQMHQDTDVSGARFTLADFNGDGILDAFTSDGNLLLGNGDGTFQTTRTFQTGSSFFGTSGVDVTAADFNGDGMIDPMIIISGQNPTYFSVLAGTNTSY